MIYLARFIVVALLASCTLPVLESTSKQKENQEGFLHWYLLEKLGRANGEGLLALRDALPSYRPMPWMAESESKSSFLKEAGEQSDQLLEAAEDFWNKNRATKHISLLGPISIPHVYVDSESEGLIASPKNSGVETLTLKEWELTKGSYLIRTLSTPGFSADGSIAVIHSSWWAPWTLLSGGSQIEIYRKEGEGWVKTNWKLGERLFS